MLNASCPTSDAVLRQKPPRSGRPQEAAGLRRWLARSFGYATALRS